MELVNLMYRYINKFINVDELIKGLENIDLSNYSEEEKGEIKNLLLEVKKIKKDIPNEIDELEIRRKERIDELLKMIDSIKKNNSLPKEELEKIDKNYNQLLKDKNIVRDGGELYKTLFNLLTNYPIINKNAEKMTDKELFKFITRYISVPLPPQISNEYFNDLVKIGVNEDNREGLWRLAFNYNNKGIDFSLIEDHFIEKKDGYYLTELICAVEDDLDLNNLSDKIKDTNDSEFIKDVTKRLEHLGRPIEGLKEENKE